ncbi:hypothetical protein WA026_015748 [Henosepilachna vigintioctopunctata]|uniref:Uncharacterized protein n=1 Tax=Henosepilachna vigintioctopunctata TaxID=420089 RepID=A0AAW1V2X8_9CUCU
MAKRFVEDSTYLEYNDTKDYRDDPFTTSFLGIRKSTPLIQAVLKNISQNLTPIRNREVDRERFTAKLLDRSENTNGVNRRRRDNINYSPGDFLLMHLDSQMHISKSDYEFLGLYEVVNCLENE